MIGSTGPRRSCPLDGRPAVLRADGPGVFVIASSVLHTGTDAPCTFLTSPFASLALEHDFVPVYRRLLSDTLTPVTAFRLIDDGGPACLFECDRGRRSGGTAFWRPRRCAALQPPGNR